VAALVKDGHFGMPLVRPGTNVNDEAGGFNVAWNPATENWGAPRLGRMRW